MNSYAREITAAAEALNRVEIAGYENMRLLFGISEFLKDVAKEVGENQNGREKMRFYAQELSAAGDKLCKISVKGLENVQNLLAIVTLVRQISEEIGKEDEDGNNSAKP